MPQSKLLQLAPEGLALARELARRAQLLEGVPVVRELPEAGVFSVGDQIALAAHDLAAALAAVGGPDGSGNADGEEAEAVLAESVSLVGAVTQRLATTRSARM